MTEGLFALAGRRVLMLGVDTPIAQISALAREAQFSAAAISCPPPPGRDGAAAVKALRKQLPHQIPILAGAGSACLTATSGIETMTYLAELDRWLRTPWRSR